MATLAYANGSSANVINAVEAAKKARLDGSDGELDAFLAKRFSKRLVGVLKETHQVAEGRPIENLWDVTVAVTEHAKTVKWQDDRVALERQGGDILMLASQ